MSFLKTFLITLGAFFVFLLVFCIPILEISKKKQAEQQAVLAAAQQAKAELAAKTLAANELAQQLMKCGSPPNPNEFRVLVSNEFLKNLNGKEVTLRNVACEQPVYKPRMCWTLACDISAEMYGVKLEQTIVVLSGGKFAAQTIFYDREQLMIRVKE